MSQPTPPSAAARTAHEKQSFRQIERRDRPRQDLRLSDVVLGEAARRPVGLRSVAPTRTVERSHVLERDEDVAVELHVRNILDRAVRRQCPLLVLATEEGDFDLFPLVLVRVVLHRAERSDCRLGERSSPSARRLEGSGVGFGLAVELAGEFRDLWPSGVPGFLKNRRDLGSETKFFQPSSSQSKSTQTRPSSLGSRKVCEPLDPCCFRFSRLVVEKTPHQRSKSSTFDVARNISRPFCGKCAVALLRPSAAVSRTPSLRADPVGRRLHLSRGAIRS